MPTIQLIDFRGDFWNITLRPWVVTDETALCETFHYVTEGPLDGYDMIPLPVFTDWWV